ncbi:MAG: transcriptional regulator, partial [Pseudomonadota bacterium]
MIEKFFYEHPVFRFEEFAKWKKDNASDTETAVYQSIHYYIQTKRIIRIKKALYAVIPPNETEESVSVDPYLIAGKASEDSVLGFHTAMELYGMAYSVFQQFYFLSQQKIKPFIFSDQYFQPVSLSKNLLKADKQQLEVDVINREGVNIKITSIERTFVDVL